MTALALLAALLSTSPAFAAAPAAPVGSEIAGDALMSQIYAKQLQPNGGITAAVAVKGAEKGIPLAIIDPNAPAAEPALAPAGDAALAPLNVAEGLRERPAKAAKRRRPSRRGVEQAENLEAAGDKASFEKLPK